MESSLLAASYSHAVISAVLPGEDGSLLVRAYETVGKKEKVRLHFDSDVAFARQVNLLEQERSMVVNVQGREVEFEVAPYSLAEVKVKLV